MSEEDNPLENLSEEISIFFAKETCNCGVSGSPKHLCPFSMEVFDSPAYCNCCDDCMKDCVRDI